MILLYTALYLWAFLYAYILVMGLYRAHLAGRLKGTLFVLGFPAILVGYAMDILTQYTVACFVFLDLPARKEFLVTARLKRYIAQGKGWRCRLANWICTHLLDPFDPTGDHC